jgi:hypothetical protein
MPKIWPSIELHTKAKILSNLLYAIVKFGCNNIYHGIQFKMDWLPGNINHILNDYQVAQVSAERQFTQHIEKFYFQKATKKTFQKKMFKFVSVAKAPDSAYHQLSILNQCKTTAPICPTNFSAPL